MLKALPSTVAGILADARSVRLERTFDAVLVLSHLLNEPADGPAFAATAAAHLVRDGLVIGEIYPRDWQPEASVGRETRVGDIGIVLERARRIGDLVDAEVRYDVAGQRWRQPFVARILDPSALSALLGSVGLRFERWLDRPGFFAARLRP